MIPYLELLERKRKTKIIHPAEQFQNHISKS